MTTTSARPTSSNQSTDSTGEPAATFADLGVPGPLVAALTKQGMTTAFPIQSATLADTLAGRDVLGRGRTGSGKTLAFSIPMVANLTGRRADPGRPLGLILAPTRELASQISATLSPLAAAAGLRTTVIFGGVSQNRQVEGLRAGVDILIACPGRLEDLRGQGHLHLNAVELTVLDEADHMADLGFLPVVRRILDQTDANGQRMLFSATLDRGVDVLVKRYLHQPLQHSVDPAGAAVTAMTHHVFEVPDPEQKKELLRRLAAGTGRRLLFTRTKHQAKKFARQLTAKGVPAVDLHGNLSQNARQRNLHAFSAGTVRVLVATDIAARGIHVDDIDLVVHVDPPAEHKAYLHRSGRTARAGAAGAVVTLVLPEQRQDVRKLLRAAKINTQVRPPSEGLLVDLIGEVLPPVLPPPAEAAGAAPAQPGPGAKSQGKKTRANAGSQRRGAGAAPAADRPGAGRPPGGSPRRSRGRGATGQSRPSQRGNRDRGSHSASGTGRSSGGRTGGRGGRTGR